MGNCGGKNNTRKFSDDGMIAVKMEENNFGDTYKLGKELGHGTYAVVYEGTKLGTTEEYAVKKVDRRKLDTEDERAMHEEKDILEMLTHPNIISYYGFFEEKRYYYLVTEIMRGGELFDRIVQKERYSEKEAKDVILVLLQALAYCHKNNVVHRDLKPENLLLVSETDDETIKIADFGFAERVTKPLTMVCGTPSYIAPEILSRSPYGLPVDIWSAGVISFILIGGYPPFYSENSKEELTKKIIAGRYQYHPKLWGHVSQDAKELIKRMLDVNPKTRITAAEALEHPWFKRTDANLSERNLNINHEEFKKFNARRKLKAAQEAIMFANSLASFARQAHHSGVHTAST